MTVEAGPPVTILADGDPWDQLLINLVRNATDAVVAASLPGTAQERGGATTLLADDRVKVGWQKGPSDVEVWVRDGGAGLDNTANLFVPSFTTKKGGTGIGLVLSRQIAEAHGGTLTLENRADAKGCVARLVLPLR